MSAELEAREPSTRYLEAVQPALVLQFELLATAQNGIARLRELILLLAVQGKLVPQDPNDHSARETLKRIQDERDRLVGTGKVKTPKSTNKVGSDELPFKTPPSWEWVPLSDIVRVLNGRAYSKQELLDVGPTPVLRVGNLFTSNHWYYSNLSLDPDKLCNPGELLFAWSASFGPFIWEGPTAIFHYHIWKLDPIAPQHFDARYFHLFLREKTAELKAAGHGVSMVHLTKEKMEKTHVPWPPLAEQARIVARVDELMRLCDALEHKGRLEAEQHARLLGTLLGTLTDSSTPEELAVNWQRVADHFDLLLDRPAAVDALEQTILQLAVRGLLVPQDPSDESASELVQRIRSYRDEQVKSGLAKRERPFTPLSEADLPFERPTGWEWIRFDDLIEPAKPISYGVLVPGPDIDCGVPFVRIADLSLTDPLVKPEKSISTEVDAQYQRTRLEGGEILMGVVGSIGKLGVAPPSWAGANIARAICRIVPVGLVDYGFVLLLLQSVFMRDSFAGDTRTLAQPTLNVGLIRSSATPLPPIAEQARIVARVTKIRRLCADLRLRLDRSSTTQASLADALIEHALPT